MKPILIVDNLQSELDLIANYLTDTGYHIVMATNREEAIAMTLDQKLDFILTNPSFMIMG